jgi:hypothetical protein
MSSSLWPSSQSLDMNGVVVSAIGLADDSCLVSDCVFKLQHLLSLTVEYCSKYHVELVPEKTKLLCFSPSTLQSSAYYWKLVSPVSLGSFKIEFSNEAEHVGILRSVDGNLPNVMSRMSAHTRALRAVLPAGLARSHSGNPAASLRIQLLYGAPVLLSGLGSLVLSKSEMDILQQYYKKSLERLQRLHQATPDSVVYFLGGSLPLKALHHMHQLSHLSMIAQLGPNHILHRLGCQTLSTAKPSSHSWFLQVREICSLYSLPDPVSTLSNPPSKVIFKKKVKSAIVDYWEKKLRYDASQLDSLVFFSPNFHSLTKPHPIWTSAGSNPYEVEKACIQARMMSGRYRTCWLSRHWSNSDGSCSLPTCTLAPTPGSLIHILTQCQDLRPARQRVFSLWADFIQDKPFLFNVIKKYTVDASPLLQVQFLLDCTVLPDVITLRQKQGKCVYDSLLYLTRTYCFSVHKTRLKLLGKWNLKK